MLIRLAIDFENPSRLWWESGGRQLWESLLEEFDSSSVVVDESIATSWLAEAERIPGWKDGPEYAPYPIQSRPVEADEDV